MRKMLWLSLVSVTLAAPAVHAQEKEKPPNIIPPTLRQATPLRLQITFTRYQGEKKVGSVPYTLSLNSPGRPAKLRMGIQVPIQSLKEPSPLQYRDVGNNLDCNAEPVDADRHLLVCTFEQSSVYSADPERRGSGSAVSEVSTGGAPLFRNFRSDASLILRDKESAQYTMATDPVSGEVLKIDVTLTVVK